MSLINSLENDVFFKNLKPAIILPELFLKFKVNVFLSSKVGEGLKNSLLAKGIQVFEKQIVSENDLKKLLEV